MGLSSLKERQIQRAFIAFINRHRHGMAVEYYNGAVFDPKGPVPGFRGMFKGYYRAKTSDRPNGFPDIVGVWYGKPFAIEVKKEKEKPSTEQLLMHQIMNDKGWPVAVCRNFSDLEAFLNQIKAREWSLGGSSQ